MFEGGAIGRRKTAVGEEKALGFLLSTYRGEESDRQFETALAIHPLWDRNHKGLLIDLCDETCRVACFGDTNQYACSVWIEHDLEDFQGSFVYILGWCYRIPSSSEHLTDIEYRGILDRHRRSLPPFDEDFSGNYAGVVYDAKRRRIAVQPDRWAMSSIYFSASERGAVVSNRATFIASLAGACFDGYSAMSLMRGTHMPFGRSLFSRVQRVMGGNHLEVNLDTGQIDLKRPFSRFVPTQKRTFEDSVEMVSKTAATVASRLVACRSAQFDLTGGNETRLVAAAISHVTHQNLRPGFGWRVLGSEDHPDVLIARKIAEICGWKLLRFDWHASREPSIEELGRTAIQADGTCTADASWDRIQSDLEAEHYGRWDWLVAAIGGEQLRGFFWTHEMLALGRTRELNYKALMDYRLYASRDVNFHLFGTQAPTMAEHDEVLLAPYREIDKAGGDLLNAYKLDSIFLQKMCYSFGTTASWLAGFRNYRYPLLSWEFTRTGLSIPWKFRADRRLVQRVIWNFDPRLSMVPNDKGEPMRPLSLATLPSYVKAALPIGAKRISRILRRSMGRFAGEKRASKNPPQNSFLLVIDDARHIDSIFDRSLIKKIRSQVASPTRTVDDVMAFHTLCTIELLLREIQGLRAQIAFAGDRIIL